MNTVFFCLIFRGGGGGGGGGGGNLDSLRDTLSHFYGWCFESNIKVKDT